MTEYGTKIFEKIMARKYPVLMKDINKDPKDLVNFIQRKIYLYIYHSQSAQNKI